MKYLILLALAPLSSAQETPSYDLRPRSTYDWDAEEWTAPVNFQVSQLVKIGGHPVNLQLGGRYQLDKPIGGADWGLRFTVTLVIPE